MPHLTRDQITDLNARQLDQRRSAGDLLEVPREVEHFSYFSRAGKAAKAAAELNAAGFRTELRKRLLKTALIARIDRDVLPDTVEATVSTVYDIVTANGGEYDGWGGTIAVAE
jgi:hypothetical protein